MLTTNQNVVLGSGEIFFSKDSNSYSKVGNASVFNITVASEKIELRSSEVAARPVIAEAVTSFDVTGSMTLQDISPDNIAYFLGGTVEKQSSTSSAAQTKSIAGVELGKAYLLALTPVSNVKVAIVDDLNDDEVELDLDGNYKLIGDDDFLWIETGAKDIEAGDTIKVTYDVDPYDTTVVGITGSKSDSNVALRFISDNRAGDNSVLFIPKISLNPTGSLEFIGDAFQEFSLEFTVLANDQSLINELLTWRTRVRS